MDVYPDLSEVDAKNLPSEPAVPEADLRDILGGFHNQVDLYNTDAREHRSIVRASKQSSPEQFLVFTAPLLLYFRDRTPYYKGHGRTQIRLETFF